MDLIDPLPPEKDREIKGDFQASATILKETLSEFGIEADITNVERGPVVTRYELLPAPGVRVEKIAALSNNIGLAMKAESVRIQAPIPGKGVVGIEVPNSKTTLVCLREVLESDAWLAGKAALPLVLGKDVGGRVIVADLAEMPHLLIAGATGSGKTVCMNSVLAGLLMSRSPDQMRLMLIDPKIVEFAAYNHLPHLVVPVITDPKKVAIGLRWAINEMEKRYKLFARVGVRNITAYNSRPIVKQAELFAGAGPDEEKPAELTPDRLPYIVIVVDELADLMLVAQADIENGIARLAQLSRAVGIHMILATQRPSVNVITGTIKANFPARIAFQVAQNNDSRTILDSGGAEKLLGRGDMLFLPPSTGKLLRGQGAMVRDNEVAAIVEFICRQAPPAYETRITEEIEKAAAEGEGEAEDVSDDLLPQAIEIIRETRRASTSALQRRLRIGYNRAGRLMDVLEQKGIVGPPRGSDPREILIDLDGDIPNNPSDSGAADDSGGVLPEDTGSGDERGQ
jgi:S-DNA-T family DNA segregation ATPase FtsK/SpoIIIE